MHYLPIHFYNIALLWMLTSLITACGGSTSNSSHSSRASSSQAPLPRECVLHSTPSIDPLAPQITLLGDRIINLPMGSQYIDAGAIAVDQDGHDVSANITTTGLENINTQIEADYFIRYEVTDSENRAAQPRHRIVRVFSEKPIKYSLRPFDSTTAPMGFLEHLPTYIGSEPNEQYPLLIVAHGWEHFVQQSPSSNRLSTLLYGANIYRVFNENLWPDSRPFIVLEPQRCLNVGDTEWHQVDQLIDWALSTYPIDPHRIYMTGMSAGGYFTYRFPVLYPNRLAAIAPMSAGGPVSTPEQIAQFCTAMEHMPLWAFHGDADTTVPVNHTLYTIDILKNQCPHAPTPPPLLTIVNNGNHVISNRIWDDSYLGKGDPQYDIQTESIYDWMLRYSLESP